MLLPPSWERTRLCPVALDIDVMRKQQSYSLLCLFVQVTDAHLAGTRTLTVNRYQEADESASRGPETPLQNRLFFHLSHKFDDHDRSGVPFLLR